MIDRVTTNAVLNEIFAEHIRTVADVLYYVGGLSPNTSVGDLINLIEELKRNNKIQ